jgi:PAS domain S-box-containing protein
LTKKHKPDLILLDVVLPDTNGVEICQQIKNDPATKHILVLLISALEIENSAQIHGLDAGADGYLVNPISKQALLAHVRVMERIKRNEDELREAAMMLEQRVKERTKAIEKTNQKLQNEIVEHKRAEEALVQEQYLMNMLMDNVPDHIYFKDTDSRFIRINKDHAKKFGLSNPTQATGKTDFDFFTEEHARPAFEDEQTIIRTGKPIVGIEEKETWPDGRETWVSTTKMPLRDKEGNIIGTFGVSRDITEHKRAEEALRKTEKKYRLLFEQNLIGVYHTTLEGDILDCNDAFINMLGYDSLEELRAHKAVDLYSTETARNNFVSCLRTEGFIKNSEISLSQKNGTTLFGLENAALIKGVEDTPSTILGTIVDITERKRAEEVLLKFRLGIERSADALFMTDANGTIVYVNPAFERIYGYTGQEVIGKTPRILKSGLLSPESYKQFWDTLLSKNVVAGEIVNKTKDGSLISIESSNNPIIDHAGTILGFLSINRDITERKRVEEGLRQMQKLEGLGTLAGGIAHDFNNILGIILAYITSIKRFKGDTKKLDLAVDTIVKAVERGKTLVQQILTFARKTETEFGAVNVNDVVMEIMTMIFETFPKVLTYTQNIDKNITFINADRSQLHQVLLNLCVNARDAMPKGGVLTINTRMVSGISLRNQHPDAAASGYVCIEVSDTGEGMTEEIRNRIFEPFFTTKEQGKGTGLGLAVVFGVVQTHKGFIDVESELGKGTTFRLYLPASQAAKPISVKDEETLEEIPGGTETLLVVEDEEMLMMSLQMVLVEKGYKVISAEDGLTAVNIYKERKKEIALVLTDLGLPKMSGMEECAQIKKLNPTARMIVATGFLDPNMKSEFLKAGIQHFLFKPYDLKQVLKVVREVLDGK